MSYSTSQSQKAQTAIKLVHSLQQYLVKALENWSEQDGSFEDIHWLRDEGTHGGGVRYVADDNVFFNRASVNVSHVHYDDLPEKRLASATALSAIVHPDNPHCPSMHIHFSWTEMRDGSGYWRMMADLNPSLPNEKNTKTFNQALKEFSGQHYELGKEQGDRYFYIPALEVHRGVSHFYLEEFNRGDFDQDYQMAEELAGHIIATYKDILESSLSENDSWTEEEKSRQIDYHTLYLYQVLTLDKGTIAGILVHNQNDLGIMGSLPAVVNGELLQSWIDKTPAPFNELVSAISEVVGQSTNCRVDNNEKNQFTNAIRSFYAKYPELINFRKVHSKRNS